MNKHLLASHEIYKQGKKVVSRRSACISNHMITKSVGFFWHSSKHDKTNKFLKNIKCRNYVISE